MIINFKIKNMNKNYIYELNNEEKKAFLEIRKNFKKPAYVYFEKRILEQIKKVKKYKAPFGLTIRFAMKANPNLSILSLMNKNGIQIDASTINEAYRALDAKIPAKKILITSQQMPEEKDLKYLVKKGCLYNATSLSQLELYGKNFPNSDISIRFNVGIGSGWVANLDTGGVNSSFGIYEKFDQIDELLNKYNLKLTRVHLHIGSGSDAKMQTEAMKKALKIVERYPKVKILNMGGGFKTARVKFEKETDLEKLSEKGAKLLNDFYKKTGRKIRLEIEPGTFLMANGGFILSEVRDVVDTGKDGMNFIKLNIGMNENTRVALYGAQHPFYHISFERDEYNGKEKEYVLVGECCESSDILTCLPGKPASQRGEKIENLKIGDILVMGGAGAYCSGMSLGNYNSKTRIAEFLVLKNGKIKKIRKEEKMKDVWKNDILI